MEIHSPDIVATQESAAELDQLGAEIAELSAHLDAATARLLDLIREFNARRGWNAGFRSCAHWLGWRMGLDLGAARERVRVARALGTLPSIARAGTAAHVERIVRGGGAWTGRPRLGRAHGSTRPVRFTSIPTRTAW